MQTYNSNHQDKVIVIDAISFNGGSKIASASILNLVVEKDVEIHVFTSRSEDWKILKCTSHNFFELPFLATRENGISYFIKHLWIACFLIWTLLFKVGSSSKITLVGTSGPGVDLSMYIASYFLKLPTVQLVHGPVACSRTIAKCLKRANIVAYLPSTRKTLIQCLNRIFTEDVAENAIGDGKFITIDNGITKGNWPTQSESAFITPHIFWAASLLKWKGLDKLTEAISRFDYNLTPKSTVCYIAPIGTKQEVSEVPSDIRNMSVFEQPENLDELRAKSNIFISTSTNEPFGLSILEAIAAGLCVVIPNDGAYWDQKLTHGVDCIKYRKGDSEDLYLKLLILKNNMSLTKKVAYAAQVHAEHYRAEKTYKKVVDAITSLAQLPSNTPC